jgi:hypothetical protein
MKSKPVFFILILFVILLAACGPESSAPPKAVDMKDCYSSGQPASIYIQYVANASKPAGKYIAIFIPKTASSSYGGIENELLLDASGNYSILINTADWTGVSGVISVDIEIEFEASGGTSREVVYSTRDSSIKGVGYAIVTKFCIAPTPMPHTGKITITPKEIFVGDCKGGEPTTITVKFEPYGGAPTGKYYVTFSYNFPPKIGGTYEMNKVYDISKPDVPGYLEVVASTMDMPGVATEKAIEIKVEYESDPATPREKIYDTKDEYGKGISASVKTKVCGRPITIECPLPYDWTALSPTGSPVTFSPGGEVNCPPITTTCNPPSGSMFPVGITPVLCTHANSCGATASCTFNVVVKPYVPVPLTITCPPNYVLPASSALGEYVPYSPPNPEGGCPDVGLICNPPSGSQFPTGLTTVNCIATDSCSASAACSFTVKINPIVAPTSTTSPNSTPVPQGCSDYQDAQSCTQNNCSWNLNLNKCIKP